MYSIKSLWPFKYLKRKFFLTLLAVYAICCFTVVCVERIEHALPHVNPMHIFFEGFDFSDAVHMLDLKQRQNVTAKDIIIINSGTTTKPELAKLIGLLNNAPSGRPKVIGIDHHFPKFRQAKIVPDTSMLQQVIMSSDNLVLGYDYEEMNQYETKENDSLPGSNYIKGRNSIGFVNISDYSGTIRTIPVLFKTGLNYAPSFALQIARQYNTNEYLERVLTNPIEDIRVDYIPNSAFTKIEKQDIFDNRSQYNFANKIVIVGNCDTERDLHFTPLNRKLAGRSFPDMPGVYIHANITYTLNGNRPFHELPAWLIFLSSTIVLLPLLAFMMVIYRRMHTFFHFASLFIYEPVIFFAQLFLSCMLYVRYVHFEFGISYLLFTFAPIAIYITDLLLLIVNKLTIRLSKGRLHFDNYFSSHH